MIRGEEYVSEVKEFFGFLIDEFHFSLLSEKIQGNAFYDVVYEDQTRQISVSYENIEDYLLVIVFLLKDGKLPDYDDKTRTLHLNHLNRVIFKTVQENDIKSNEEFFSRFIAKGEFKGKLLKVAKELRLCLLHFNKYFDT